MSVIKTEIAKLAKERVILDKRYYEVVTLLDNKEFKELETEEKLADELEELIDQRIENSYRMADLIDALELQETDEWKGGVIVDNLSCSDY